MNAFPEILDILEVVFELFGDNPTASTISLYPKAVGDALRAKGFNITDELTWERLYEYNKTVRKVKIKPDGGEIVEVWLCEPHISKKKADQADTMPFMFRVGAVANQIAALRRERTVETNGDGTNGRNRPANAVGENVKQELLDHLATLIQEGNRLNSSYRMTDRGTQESDLPESDFRSFATATLATVERIAGRDSEYHHSLPLVDISDPLAVPGYNNTKIPAMIGALKSLRQAVDKGLLTSLESRLRASIHNDLQRAKENEATMATDKRKVFVVYGRNNVARNAMFTFLRAIGLHPLEWSEIVKETGEASPYVGEVLKVGFSIVQAVVVLLTPDDEARLRQPYRVANDPKDETELTPQPRPNVLLEAGMALGLFPERTVIVELGRLRPISDIHGRHVIRLDNSPQKRQALAQRLETAGCAVNLSGTDWLTSGGFDAATADCDSVPAEPASSVETEADLLADYSLSAEARRLLALATSSDGQVGFTRTSSGCNTQAGGTILNEPHNARSEATWKQAIQDLVDHKLLEGEVRSGYVCEVTAKGYEVADLLQRQEGV